MDPGRRVGQVLAACAVLGLVSAALLATSARSWAGGHLADEILLPGTLVASVPVGGSTADDARAAVTDAVQARLERRVTVRHGDRAWTTSLGELGGQADVDAGIDAALLDAAGSSTFDLVRVRWLGGEVPISAAVRIHLPRERLDAFVAGLAADLDGDARTAVPVWADGSVVVEPSAAGLEVDRRATTDGVVAALRGDGDEVDVAAEVLAPPVDTETASSALELMGGPITAALDRSVEVVHGDDSWTVTPRDLAAVPDLAPLFESAVDAVRDGGPAEPFDGDVGLDIPEDTVDAFLAEVAGTIDVAPRDARLDHSSGWIEFVPGRDGLAVDRERASLDLVASLRGGGETVSLDVGPARPRVTLDDLRHVVLVRQGERRAYLYRDQRIIRDWPIAVGLAGSPTPTGVFTIGAKRANPTWYNPSPTGWGSDMPPVIGPGPDNPLGLRALNWNRDGRDTLIRFHGTPNEASIGEAASRGCVRMRNADVIELFDLVPTGATVVSLNVGNPPPRDDEDDQRSDGVEDADDVDA